VINSVTGVEVPLRPLPPLLLRVAARIDTALAALGGREPEATPEGVAIACARAHVVSDLAARELGYRPADLVTMVEDSWRWLRLAGLACGRRHLPPSASPASSAALRCSRDAMPAAPLPRRHGRALRPRAWRGSARSKKARSCCRVSVKARTAAARARLVGRMGVGAPSPT
jgi:hypothetical protein